MENIEKDPVCKDCKGTGRITVDTFNGEHGQYESVCQCKIDLSEDGDDPQAD